MSVCICGCRYVIVGGGNSVGYAARTFVEHGVADGKLCIVSKEVFHSIIWHKSLCCCAALVVLVEYQTMKFCVFCEP